MIVIFARGSGHGITYSLSDRDGESYIQAPWMQACCEGRSADAEKSDWISLIECTNASSYMQREIMQNKIGGVGLVTYATRDIWNYSAYSFAVNEIYCESNGYIMRHLDEDSGPQYDQYDSRWNKVKALEEALEPEKGWGRNLDWIVWLDADAIILDMNMHIEKVAASRPNAHILMSAEHAGSSTLVNSGTIIVKNSEWSRRFLHMWWTYRNRKLYSDQEQFDLLYQSFDGDTEFREKIAILPPDAINSDPPAMTQQKPYNQILHLMGEHLAFRVRVFNAGLFELCSKMGTQTYPELQLGLSRDKLRQWTLEEYGEESEKLLQEYSTRATAGLNTRKESVRVSNSVHHFAHALGEGSRQAQSLRNKVYILVRENLQARRAQNEAHKQATGRILEEWPEHLKCLAEAGQHLLQFGPISDRLRVAEEVSATLREMLLVSHVEQHRAVHLMIAHMDFEEGLVHMAGGDNDSGIRAFSRGLERHRELSLIMGNHILISPLSSMASALCTVRRFAEAVPKFEEAIRIAKEHVGRNHASLGVHLLNFGISRVQAGDYDRAESILTEALGIIEANEVEGSNGALALKCASFLYQAQAKEGALSPFSTSSGNNMEEASSGRKLAFRRRRIAPSSSRVGDEQCAE